MSQPRAYFQHVENLDDYGSTATHTRDASNEIGSPSMGNGTLTKQFQPKKFKDGNKMWNHGTEQSGQEIYSYTPFKAKTTNKPDVTPKPTREDSQHSGTLRPPKNSPFIYDPPTTQSTPKMARPGSAQPMQREQKLTWGRVPPSSHVRSASAMGAASLRRPPRTAEFAPIVQHPHYQSYCTLPRPEQVDIEALAHAHAFYPPPPQMISRPPSANPSLGPLPPTVVPMMPPVQMASNLATYLPPGAPSPKAVSQLAVGPSLINWNGMSLICCMQVLCCVAVFGVGVARMLYGSLWAIGIEIVYSTAAMIPALVGIYAVKRGSYAAAFFTYASNILQIVFATIPFAIGLFPLIPLVFPKVNSSWLVNTDEPEHLDFALSLLVALHVLFCLLLTISGTKSIGNLYRTIDEMRLQNNVKAAFETSENLPYKS